MKRLILSFCALCAILVVGCGPNRTKEVQKISQCEDSLMNNASMVVIDTAKGSRIINLYLQFADDFPTDTLSPSYIYKAGDIAYNICKYDVALQCFKRIIDSYPKYSELGTCYFMMGEAYNASKQYDKAREAYQTFVNKFPDHPLAKDTRYQLENHLIGLSPEEMLNYILKNNEAVEEVVK